MKFRIFILACIVLMLSGCKLFDYPLYSNNIGATARNIIGTYSKDAELVDIKESNTLTNGYDLVPRNRKDGRYSFRLVVLNNQVFADVNFGDNYHMIRRLSIDNSGITVFDDREEGERYNEYESLLSSGGVTRDGSGSMSTNKYHLNTTDLQKIVRKYADVFSHRESRLERL